jgi:hypothetical protein
VVSKSGLFSSRPEGHLQAFCYGCDSPDHYINDRSHTTHEERQEIMHANAQFPSSPNTSGFGRTFIACFQSANSTEVRRVTYINTTAVPSYL